MPQTLRSRSLPPSLPECAHASGDGGADLALVTRALAGERTARVALARRMLCIPGQVRIRMRRHGIRPSEDEISDVSQEIFAAIWERLERYRGDSPLEGWAYGFVARITLSAMRGHSQRPDSLSDEEAASIEKVTSTGSDAVHDTISALLSLLRPQEERLIQLRYFEGLNYTAIGQRLSCTERAARARFQRAMDRLRDLAKDRGIQPS